MTNLIASVVIDGSAYSFDKHYDYAIPRSLTETCIPGCRVVVPFGRGNSKKQATVMRVFENKAGNTSSLKNILFVTDKEPVLNGEMLALAEWLKDHTFCTYSDAIHTMLPTGLNVKIADEYSLLVHDRTGLSFNEERIVDYIATSKNSVTAKKIDDIFGINNSVQILQSLTERGFLKVENNPIRKIGDATVKMARLCDQGKEIAIKLTAKQKDVVNVLQDAGTLSVKEITYFTGVGPVVIKNLEKYGIIELFDNEIYRSPFEEKKRIIPDEIVLTDDQREVYDTVSSHIDREKFSPVLLHGITGSGKTQVFLKLVEKVVKSGRGVIVMVPEISLTPQMLEVFYSRFGDTVAVFHSALSLGQRLDEWKRVKNGRAKIALGTRSAVFAPFEDLGLIVMDEEQEHTYKSENSPKFHTRDVAKFRAAYNKCVCLFSSATPSIETYSAAKSGHYTLCTLNKRYGNAVLPKVIPIDMRAEALMGNNGNFSIKLTEEIEKTLNKKEQVILLLNRRGHNTYVSCPSCGYVASCKNCSISMTYHSASGRLMCHYCGYSEPYTEFCPNCGGNHLRYSGAGTQKAEDELSLLFPGARILRLDADTTMTKNAFSDKLSAFSRGEYDILIGTQMVAKGLNFPNVTLVGVLCADQSMYSDDYRGFERTFALLTQVVGRSGRGNSPGRAYIQTLNPDSNIIKLAASQNYAAFYEDEILTRKLMIYPPYCDIISVTAFGTSQSSASNAAQAVVDLLISGLKNSFSDVKLVVLRPTPPAVPRVNNKYRYRIIIKCKNNKRFRELLTQTLEKYYETKYSKNVTISVDVNPDGSF